MIPLEFAWQLYRVSNEEKKTTAPQADDPGGKAGSRKNLGESPSSEGDQKSGLGSSIETTATALTRAEAIGRVNELLNAIGYRVQFFHNASPNGFALVVREINAPRVPGLQTSDRPLFP